MAAQHRGWWVAVARHRVWRHTCSIRDRSETVTFLRPLLYSPPHSFHRLPSVSVHQSCHTGRPHTHHSRPFSQSFVPEARSSSVAKQQSGHVSPLFLTAEKHLGRTAILDRFGRFTYDDILHLSSRLSKDLIDLCDSCSSTGNLQHERVAFLCENDVSYLVTQMATWMANGVGVPLCKSHPVSELQYFIQDSQCSVLVASQCFADKLRPLAQELNIPLRVIDDRELTCGYEVNEWFAAEAGSSAKPKVKKSRPKRWYDMHLFNNGFKHDPALIIYTSGTTGRPKGVVLTHGNLWAQQTNMVSAWEWSPRDVLLHVLPLHHVHGVVNALMTPLHVGATCLIMPTFDPLQVWSSLVNPVSQTGGVRVNMFMAVPTIYVKLMQHYEQQTQGGGGSGLAGDYIKSVCMARIRLMVSGSAALPQPVMEKWETITGHRLLERYGMTEIGMALTNPLSGHRIPGSVGRPFPSVEVCISKPNVYAKNGYDSMAVGNAQRTTVTQGEEEESGELLVKGPSVFHQYWNRPQATAEAFTPDGWFKTGDTVKVSSDGVYSILGRTSVDVIKSGGYKLSALDIERHLLTHPVVTDCAVVGLPDITWGQRVAVVMVIKEGERLSLEDLKVWARELMPPYQVPSVLRCLETMPRNAMGKVNKKELVTTVFPDFLKDR